MTCERSTSVVKDSAASQLSSGHCRHHAHRATAIVVGGVLVVAACGCPASILPRDAVTLRTVESAVLVVCGCRPVINYTRQKHS